MKTFTRLGLVQLPFALLFILALVGISTAEPLPEEILKICPADTIAISHADYSNLAENKFFKKAVADIKSDEDRKRVIEFYKNVKTVTTFATDKDFVYVIRGNIRPEEIGKKYLLFFGLFKFCSYIEIKPLPLDGIYAILFYGTRTHKMLFYSKKVIDGRKVKNYPDDSIVLIPAKDMGARYKKMNSIQQVKLKKKMSHIDTSRELWFFGDYRSNAKEPIVTGSFNLTKPGGELKINYKAANESKFHFPHYISECLIHKYNPMMGKPCDSNDKCKIPEATKLLKYFQDMSLSVGAVGFPLYFKIPLLPYYFKIKITDNIFELLFIGNATGMEIMFLSYQKSKYCHDIYESRLIMKQIFSFIRWFKDEKKYYPESFEELVKFVDETTTNWLNLYYFVSYLNPDRKDKGISQTSKITNSIPDDYIYCKPPQDAPEDWIIIYENLKYHDNKGTNVLLLNGEVKWMNKKEFEEQIK